MNGACAALRALAIALSLSPAPARGEGATRVAVLGASSGASGPAAAAVARAAGEAAGLAGADAVPPDEVSRAVLSAGAEAATCGKNAACATAVCAAVRADALLAVSLVESGSVWVVEMRLREAGSGSLRGHAVEATKRDERAATDAAARLATRLVQQLLSARSAAPATSAAQPASVAQAPASTATSTAKPAATSTAAVGAAAPPPRGGETGRLSEEAATATTSRADAESGARPPPPRAIRDERLVAERRGPEPARSSRRGWGTILLAGGAALLAGGATAGALAWSDTNAANGSLARGDLGEFVAARQSSRTLAWTAAGLGGAGAVALAAGAWLRIGGRSSPVSLQVEPGVVGARVAVAF